MWIRKYPSTNKPDDFRIIKHITFRTVEWNDSFKFVNSRMNGFTRNPDRDEIALFTIPEGRMVISSTAFYRDFDYDLQMENKGKINYKEDYSDKWSQYMLGAGHMMNWMNIDQSKIKNKNYKVLSWDGSKVKVTESVTFPWFKKTFKNIGTDAVYIHPTGKIYS